MISTSQKNNPEVSCPYDPSHRMAESKLIWHISGRCRAKEQYGHLFETCPHNPLHIKKKELMLNHLKNCPDVKNNEGEIEDDIAAAIGKQFKPNNKQVQTEKITQKNQSVPGYIDEGENDSMKPKKKRVRAKKGENQAKSSTEINDWHEISYGAHAQKITNAEESNEDDEYNFEKEFNENKTDPKKNKKRR